MDKDGDDILRYHRGELSPAEMHALEKKALSDPFLADALEGAGQIPAPDFAKDVAALQGRIAGGAKPVFTPLRIAAGIALLAAAGWIGLSILDNNKQEQLTFKEELPVSPSPQGVKDSAAADKAGPKEQTGTKPTDEPKKEQLLALDAARDDRKEAPKTTGELKREQLLALQDAKREKKEEAEQKEGVKEELAAREPEAELAEGSADRTDYILSAEETSALRREAKNDSTAAPFVKQPVATQVSTGAGETRTAKAAARTVADDVAPTVIRGQVTLAEDGLALPGATIHIKGTSRGTVTDLNGNYSIDASEQRPTLVFSFIGMQTREASPISGPTLDVALTEDVSQLSEVVVTGKKIPTDKDDNPVIKLAEPVGGYKAYDGYLYGNLRIPQQAIENNVKGRVTIQFTVGTSGSLGEFTVMKGLGFGCDEEVIRLVKEGPAWKPTTENEIPTESLVRVRMKFDPAKARR